MDDAVIDSFIESWGMMGSVWGINTSTARVHALLIASGSPVSLDEIAKRLRISRGNASMCLRELRDWGVVRLIKEPGDRQDYYVTEPDVWKMFIAVTRGRKRREFDPVLKVVRETSSAMHEGSGATVRKRLKELEGLLSTLDAIAERFLSDEGKMKYVLSILSHLPAKRKRK